MGRLDPGKLTVEFREGVTETVPIIPRRYTLTHSDITADLFLTIAPDFAFDQLNAMRDEVLGEWLLIEGGLRYYVYLHVDGQFGQGTEAIRNKIFRRELPLALEAIRYGDRKFFEVHPELDQYAIIVYFLSSDPEYNKAEYWGTFADYDTTTSENTVMANSMMEYHVLIDEKTGDVNGDGVPDRVSVYGDKVADSDFVTSIIIEIKYGQSELGVQVITETNAYHPTLFLGDFTKDKTEDILIRMDVMYNSMNSKDKGRYGAGLYFIKSNQLEMAFESNRYNDQHLFLAEYNDFYKISAANVMLNKLFYLDISNKGFDYLSQYYYENGKLIKPVPCSVLPLGALIPVVSSEKGNFFDLLAVHRIIGASDSDTLGYIENLMSWNGEQFVTVRMTASTTGTDLIAQP